MICHKCRETMALLYLEHTFTTPETWYCKKDKLYAMEMPGINATDQGYIVYYGGKESSDGSSG